MNARREVRWRTARSSGSTALWAASSVALAATLIWLGLTLLSGEASELPDAFWAAALAALAMTAGWGWLLFRLRHVPLPPVDGAAEVWEELRPDLAGSSADVRQVAGLVEALALTSQPLPRATLRLRDALQESLRRTGFAALIHEGGDPHVLAHAQALGVALDRLLVGRSELRIELRAAGSMAEIAVRGGEAVRGLTVLRRLIQAQGGELLVDDAVRIQLRQATPMN